MKNKFGCKFNPTKKRTPFLRRLLSFLFISKGFKTLTALNLSCVMQKYCLFYVRFVSLKTSAGLPMTIMWSFASKT